MVCGVLSVVGLYLAWVKLVYEPAGIHYLVLARHAVGGGDDPLSVGHLVPGRLSIHPADHSLIRAVVPVAVGCMPYALASESDRRLEWLLTASLGALAFVAYGAGIVAVENQREAADAAGNGGEYWLET